ncbi:MAG: hypothetical protein ACO32I_08000, partial [Candidatus Limnocylindrus sp.]
VLGVRLTGLTYAVRRDVRAAVVRLHRPMDIIIALAICALGICIGQALCMGELGTPLRSAARPTSRCATTSQAQRLHSRRSSR